MSRISKRGLAWPMAALAMSGMLAAGAGAGALQDKSDKVAPGPAPAKLGLILNDARAFQGYTLFSPLNSKTAYLMDMAGKVVRSWEGAATPASSAYLLADGHLLRPCLLTDATQPGGGQV